MLLAVSLTFAAPTSTRATVCGSMSLSPWWIGANITALGGTLTTTIGNATSSNKQHAATQHFAWGPRESNPHVSQLWTSD